MRRGLQERQAFWQDVLERQRQSSLSVREFCRRNQLSEPSFYSWKKKLRGEHAGNVAPTKTPEKCSEPQRRTPDPTATPVFVPVRISDAGQSLLELIHPRGHVLRVPSDYDPQALQQVLALLDQQ